MDKSAAQELAKKLQISVNYVVREEYEMLLLKQIFESPFGAHVVFKGGTALRLGHGSPRFSEDLDFTALPSLKTADFLRFLKALPKSYPALQSVETIKKFNTLFGLAKIEDPAIPRPFSIKFEVSTRDGTWVESKDYIDMLIKSETAVFTVLARVASLERILTEKKHALKSRRAPRDAFDYWFINQRLGKQVALDFTGYDTEAVVAEMHRLLPRPYWRVLPS